MQWVNEIQGKRRVKALGQNNVVVLHLWILHTLRSVIDTVVKEYTGLIYMTTIKLNTYLETHYVLAYDITVRGCRE